MRDRRTSSFTPANCVLGELDVGRGLSGSAESEEERSHEDVAIEFFEGLDESQIFFRITSESGAPESLSRPFGPCEHDPFGDDPRALLEEALTEEELDWVCGGCETATYEAQPGRRELRRRRREHRRHLGRVRKALTRWA